MNVFLSQVFDKLQDVHSMVGETSSSSPHLHPPHLHLQPPSQSLSTPPCPLDSSVGVLSQGLSTLGPLEDTYQPSQSSSSSSSFCSLTHPHPLLSSSSLPVSPSSFAGPCETDESRGFSQYDLRSRFRSSETSCRSLSASTGNHYHSQTGPAHSQFSQPSVPTEDQYSFPPQPSSTSDVTGAEAPRGPDPRGPTRAGAAAGLHGVPESLSPVGSLHSSSPGSSGTSVHTSTQFFFSGVLTQFSFLSAEISTDNL